MNEILKKSDTAIVSDFGNYTWLGRWRRDIALDKKCRLTNGLSMPIAYRCFQYLRHRLVLRSWIDRNIEMNAWLRIQTYQAVAWGDAQRLRGNQHSTSDSIRMRWIGSEREMVNDCV